MASVNISEADFFDVANAAGDAMKDGDRVRAERLDKLARKMNAALASRRGAGLRAARMFGGVKPLTWKDVPSTLVDVDGEIP